MGGELRLLVSEEGADAERLAQLAAYLRRELLLLDVEDVTGLPIAEAPPGAKGTVVSAAGGLLVGLGQAADGLRSVVSLVTDWLGRGGGTRRTVRLELGGDVLELSRASEADQTRLIDLFVSRHEVSSGKQ
jgi:hypothetical protein